MNSQPTSDPIFSTVSSIDAVLEAIRALKKRKRPSIVRRMPAVRNEELPLPEVDERDRLIEFARETAAFQRPYLADTYTAEPGAAVRDDDEENPGCKKIVFKTREGEPETYRGLAVGRTRLGVAAHHERTTPKIEFQPLPWLAKLTALTKLNAGWDGYKAPPPTHVVVAAARDFLTTTAEFPPDRVAPSVVGGIGVTYRKNGRKVYVEFRNTGSILALFSDGSTEPAVEPVDPGEYPAFLARARGYLGE